MSQSLSQSILLYKTDNYVHLTYLEALIKKLK
jgi:hypothetical protein